MPENYLPRELVPIFFEDTASSYDKIVLYTTFGRDKFWKNQILDKVSGRSILDLACGTGILTRLIAQKFQESEIVGVDITRNYLEIAKQNSKQFTNILFINQDAEKLEIDKKFDCIVSSYIPKYCDARTLIQKCINHLNTEGVIILHDFTYPKNKTIQTIWNRYFHLLQFSGYFIPKWKEAFLNLPKLIRTSKWVEDYSSAMKEEGLDVEFEYHTFGCCCIITGKSD
jgi:demethylmenaquinone methyltransferase/2-methoxy-6-polyprenyl-1,4-benzoquinol methylase